MKWLNNYKYSRDFSLQVLYITIIIQHLLNPATMMNYYGLLVPFSKL